MYTYTRGHAYKSYKSRSLASISKNFFSERVINIWNALPGYVVDFTSLSKFRSLITLRRSFAEYRKQFVAHFNDVRASGYNSAGSVRIRMKFGAL